MLAQMRPVLRDSILVAPSYVVPGVVSLLLVGLLFATLGAAQYGVWALMFALASACHRRRRAPSSRWSSAMATGVPARSIRSPLHLRSWPPRA